MLKTVGAMILLAAVFTAACSGSGSTSPTSPSAGSFLSSVDAAAAVQPDAKGGNGNGRGNGGNPGNGIGNGHGDDSTPGNPHADPPTTSTPGPSPAPPFTSVAGRIEIEGLISAIAGLSITVNDLSVQLL